MEANVPKSRWQGIGSNKPKKQEDEVNYVTFPGVQVPRDPKDPDFVLSFDLNQHEEYLNVFPPLLLTL